MHYFYFSLICVIWGSSFMLIKITTLAFGTFSIATMGAFGGTLTIGFFWYVKKPAFGFRKKHVVPLVFLILLGYVIPFVIQPYLIAEIGHGFIGVIVSLVPLLTILVSVPMLGVYPSRKQILGSLGGVFCIGLIMLDGLQRNVSVPMLIAAVIVPLLYAVSNTLVQRSFSGISPISLSGSCMAMSCLLTLPMAIAANETVALS